MPQRSGKGLVLSESPRVHVVSHTHWDREWYLPREQFRLMLVDLVDRVISILEENSEYRAFMLDGQAIVLEDYLEIKPANSTRIEQLVRSGRLLIGPWYVLPDEILISGESHIRNYLEGRRICGRFGGSMQTGYLPDSFGHPSQMPQILRGLGLREIVFWRGLGPEIDTVEFTWRGIDGSTILGLNLPESYGNGACMPRKQDQFRERLRIKTAPLASKSITGQLLIMNGVDHVAPDASVPRLLREAEAAMQGFTLSHSTLPEYISSVRKRLNQDHLKTTEGELRSGYRNYLLGGTLSTRMHLKQRNFQTEQLIEKEVEPAATLVWALSGTPYPKEQLRHLWRQHLQNLPHDSICGCSVDAVHEEMMMRYRLITQAAEHIKGGSMEQLASSVTLADVMAEGADTTTDIGTISKGVLLFNQLIESRDEMISCRLDYTKWPTRMVNYETGVLEEYSEPEPLPQAPEAVELIAPSGERIIAKVHAVETDEVLETSLETQPKMYKVMRGSISFLARDLPPIGYKAYRLRWLAHAEADERVHSEGPTGDALENDYFRVEPDGKGALTVFDKRSGKEYCGVGALVDGGDAGDEYNYSPPVHDRLIEPELASLSAEVETHGPRSALVVRGELNLPRSLTGDRRRRDESTVSCPYMIRAELNPTSPRVDVTVSFTNHARDHRLRIIFPGHLRATVSQAEGIFSVDTRPIEEMGEGQSETYSDWVEPPDGHHPQKSFVDVSDGESGLAVANKGLPEYQIVQGEDGSTILVTLLRSVGWLSRPDLLTRKGNGGWTIPTDGAQCLGSYTFELSLIPHTGDWLGASVAHIARRFTTPPLVHQICHYGSEAVLPSEVSLVSCESDRLTVSAVKRAEERDLLVVRLVNLSPEHIESPVRFGTGAGEIYELGLDETVLGTHPGGRNAPVNLQFGPWEVKTIGIAVGNANGRPNRPLENEPS